MATSTDVPIYTSTLTGSASSVTIDLSAYQQYTNLKIVDNTTTSTGDSHLFIQFNGDSSSGLYSSNFLYGQGSAATANKGTNMNGIYISRANGSTGIGTTYIYNYSNSSMHKTTLSRGSDSDYVFLWNGLWRNNNAITSITITTTGNFLDGSTFSVYGTGTAAIATKATGGAIYSDTNYMYHVFTSTGTFTPLQSLSCDYVVVAGGGGGGYSTGGGGGAGGLRSFTSQSLTATSYTVTIGGGGAGASSQSMTGVNGGGSSFNSISTSGGGGGGSQPGSGSYSNGASGGSGGGAPRSGNSYSGGSGNAGGYTPVEGYAGGNNYSAGAVYGTGGGGGAGGVGQTGTSTYDGAGGIGATSSLITAIVKATGVGQLVSDTGYLAGGGGGANGTDTSLTNLGAPGGYGGGGKGGSNYLYPVNGTPNSGGGGGGAGYVGGFNNAANGGSGVVIVRYAK